MKLIIIVILLFVWVEACSDEPCDERCEYEACLKTKEWLKENHSGNKYAETMECVRPLQ